MLRRIHDNTVPYPTASISYTDPFADPSNLHIETDENHIVQSYLPIADPDPESLAVNHANEIDVDGEEVTVKISVLKPRRTASAQITGRKRPLLPPFLMLPLRYPFNHVSVIKRIVMMTVIGLSLM